MSKGKQTNLRTPRGWRGEKLRVWKALKPHVKDTSANAYILQQVCELFLVWEETKYETQPQKFYRGLAALKQATALSTKLGLISCNEPAVPKKPFNPLDEILGKRGRSKIANN